MKMEENWDKRRKTRSIRNLSYTEKNALRKRKKANKNKFVRERKKEKGLKERKSLSLVGSPYRDSGRRKIMGKIYNVGVLIELSIVVISLEQQRIAPP